MRQTIAIYSQIRHFMTKNKRYNTDMNTLLFPASAGFLWIGFLFGLCFLLVHLAKLVKLGWAHRTTPPKATPTSEKEEKKAPASTPQEPVYYIVEKKRRAKTSFGEPKQIRFK